MFALKWLLLSVVLVATASAQEGFPDASTSSQPVTGAPAQTSSIAASAASSAYPSALASAASSISSVLAASPTPMSSAAAAASNRMFLLSVVYG